MKHGDISNRTSMRIVINIEDLIDAEKVKNFFFVNKEVLKLKVGSVAIINNLWRNSDFTFSLIGIYHDEKAVEKLLVNVYHSGLVLFDDEEDMARAIRENYTDYYVDSNYERRIRIAVTLPYTRCIPFNELTYYIGGGRV